MRRAAITAAALCAAALLALAPSALGSAGHVGDVREDWWTRWSAEPLALGSLVLAGVLYALRARRLGARLSPWRRASFAAGLAVVAFAICSPIDPIGENGLLAVHMLQHALLGSLGPLLVVLGLTGPVLAPVLRLPGVVRLRVLAHPAVALPLWLANLLAWHVPAAYELGVSSEPVHVLQHAANFTAAALLWAAVVEPLPGPRWFGTGPKLGYLAAVWFIGLAFTNVFWFSGSVFYPRYEESAPAWGVSALQDQANAGSVFMVEHLLIVFVTMAVLAARLAREGALQRRLVEAGLDPRRVRHAVRYGRAADLARQAGVPLEVRAGID